MKIMCSNGSNVWNTPWKYCNEIMCGINGSNNEVMKYYWY